MVGVQDASDTNSLITPTSVVMQILVLLAASLLQHHAVNVYSDTYSTNVSLLAALALALALVTSSTVTRGRECAAVSVTCWARI